MGTVRPHVFHGLESPCHVGFGWRDARATRSPAAGGWLRLIVALGLAASALFTAAAATSPNVVIILADDQGWGDLGFTGNIDGDVHLQAGRGELTLRALRVAGRSVMDVDAVVLELLP